MKIPWVFLVTSAFGNIMRQFVILDNELQHANESLALDTFSVDIFFPFKDQQCSIRNSLVGVSSVLSILGGFLLAGPAFSAAGTVISGAGTFLRTHISASDELLQAQQIFSAQVLAYYRALLSGLEDLVARLSEGQQIAGPRCRGFSMSDMLANVTGVDPRAVSNVSQINGKIRTEILARGIDALWKTPPSNKMWVLFTDLQDDGSHAKCLAGTCFL